MVEKADPPMAEVVWAEHRYAGIAAGSSDRGPEWVRRPEVHERGGRIAILTRR
jgi:hypothetical protein